MTGNQLARHRKEKKRTQVQTARALGVSQTYLSLLESGERRLTDDLQAKAAKFFNLSPTELPSRVASGELPSVSDAELASDLADLGYVGFGHLRRKRPHRKNPADVLLSALNGPKRDARVVEGLPWLVLTFPDMDWRSAARTAKVYDLQNRLGYVANVARLLAEREGRASTAARLAREETLLERSKLAVEGTLCNDTMTNAERRWLKSNRPDSAKRWNLLTDLSPRHLNYA